ncbi:MAG: hypothetical protein E6G17_02455 [Actinobacteria bacterium]|nr:MAG: hypothetical protein E6G17_02455 [Actinomycetota bacterium]
MARALDAWWHELGDPDQFVVVDAGAGCGTLARDVLAAEPSCSPALHYVLVERSDSLRAAHADNVALEPARVALGRGPTATSLQELPAGPLTGVVLANELLDNLGFRLLERGAQGWSEVRVGETDGRLVEVLVAASDDLGAEADGLVSDPPDGARVSLQHAARAWLRDALGVLGRGRVVVFDYADTTPAMARRPWRQWLRTFRAHGPGQLARVRAVTADRPQAEFLRAFGIDELAVGARAAWESRAHVGDLEALKHRSRVTEVEALTDPAGLGAFRVLEWVLPVR